MPGLLSGQCVNSGGANYLAVTTRANPADPRTDSIGGDVTFAGLTLQDWGLHLLDMNLVQDDLIALVGSQSAAYAAEQAAR